MRDGWGRLAFMAAGLVEYAPSTSSAGAAGRRGIVLGPELDSFPSGHDTSVFAVATVLGAFYPRVRWPLYGLAGVIALGRVSLDRHYASDVVAGALIGLAIASFTLRHHRVNAAGRADAS
jgi:membrane-associated phospholipid phosphatase